VSEFIIISSSELFYMRIIGIKDVIQCHERQFLDVGEQAPDVFRSQRRHIDRILVVREHPQVTGTDSFEAVTAEGAGLRSCAPATMTKHG
jgi:hypothetical protein